MEKNKKLIAWQEAIFTPPMANSIAHKQRIHVPPLSNCHITELSASDFLVQEAQHRMINDNTCLCIQGIYDYLLVCLRRQFKLMKGLDLTFNFEHRGKSMMYALFSKANTCIIPTHASVSRQCVTEEEPDLPLNFIPVAAETGIIARDKHEQLDQYLKQASPSRFKSRSGTPISASSFFGLHEASTRSYSTSSSSPSSQRQNRPSHQSCTNTAHKQLTQFRLSYINDPQDNSINYLRFQHTEPPTNTNTNTDNVTWCKTYLVTAEDEVKINGFLDFHTTLFGFVITLPGSEQHQLSDLQCTIHEPESIGMTELVNYVMSGKACCYSESLAETPLKQVPRFAFSECFNTKYQNPYFKHLFNDPVPTKYQQNASPTKMSVHSPLTKQSPSSPTSLIFTKSSSPSNSSLCSTFSSSSPTTVLSSSSSSTSSSAASSIASYLYEPDTLQHYRVVGGYHPQGTNLYFAGSEPITTLYFRSNKKQLEGIGCIKQSDTSFDEHGNLESNSVTSTTIEQLGSTRGGEVTKFNLNTQIANNTERNSDLNLHLLTSGTNKLASSSVPYHKIVTIKFYFGEIPGISKSNSNIVIHGLELNGRLFGMPYVDTQHHVEFKLNKNEYLVGVHGQYSHELKAFTNLGIITQYFRFTPPKQLDPYHFYQNENVKCGSVRYTSVHGQITGKKEDDSDIGEVFSYQITKCVLSTMFFLVNKTSNLIQCISFSLTPPPTALPMLDTMQPKSAIQSVASMCNNNEGDEATSGYHIIKIGGANSNTQKHYDTHVVEFTLKDELDEKKKSDSKQLVHNLEMEAVTNQIIFPSASVEPSLSRTKKSLQETSKERRQTIASSQAASTPKPILPKIAIPNTKPPPMQRQNTCNSDEIETSAIQAYHRYRHRSLPINPHILTKRTMLSLTVDTQEQTNSTKFEKITEVKIFASHALHGLEFVTSTGRVVKVGDTSLLKHMNKFQLAEHEYLVGFHGKASDGQIHYLGLITEAKYATPSRQPAVPPHDYLAILL